MVEIRHFRVTDRDALYRICLATGDAGKDASHLYEDPELIGQVYAGGYAALSPETIFVVEDDEGVAGYIVGAADTRDFEARLEALWWPALRARYADPDEAAPHSPDARMRHLIHHPPHTPRRIADAYPAHLHINLLPRMQRRGLGRRLMAHWLEAVGAMGATAAHLAVGTRNSRAVEFYRACGFHEIERAAVPFDVITFGIAIQKETP